MTEMLWFGLRMMEVEYNPPHVMWAGMTATCHWPLFFDGNVNTIFYVEMLEVQLMT